MKRSTAIAIVGAMLLLTLVLGCASLSIAARTGIVSDTLIRFPPDTRYQLILRIGSDGRHWGGDNLPQQAINVWIHGRGTSWHVVNLIHIPLGERDE